MASPAKTGSKVFGCEKRVPTGGTPKWHVGQNGRSGRDDQTWMISRWSKMTLGRGQIHVWAPVRMTHLGVPRRGPKWPIWGSLRGTPGGSKWGVGTIRCRIADKMTPKWVILGQKGGFGGPDLRSITRQRVLFGVILAIYGVTPGLPLGGAPLYITPRNVKGSQEGVKMGHMGVPGARRGSKESTFKRLFGHFGVRKTGI